MHKLRSVVAEVDKVAPGKGTACLLNAAARLESAEMNGREAEAGDEVLHEFDWLGVIARDKYDAPATALYGPLVKAFHHD